ncbi:hypothetical protein [Streptomyces alfalfae]
MLLGRVGLAAGLLDDPAASAALRHLAAATARGVLDADLPVRAVMSCVEHSNKHRAVVSDIPVTLMPLGTAGQLADPAARTALATMARYTDAIGSNLRKNAAMISRHSREAVAARLLLTDLGFAWSEAVDTSARDLPAARAAWRDAVHRAAEDKINMYPLRPFERGQLLATYTRDPDPAPSRRAPAKDTASTEDPDRSASARPRGRGRTATTYEAFGGQHTLAQLSKHPSCTVSYNTLRKRVEDGMDAEQAATTPANAGRPPKK